MWDSSNAQVVGEDDVLEACDPVCVADGGENVSADEVGGVYEVYLMNADDVAMQDVEVSLVEKVGVFTMMGVARIQNYGVKVGVGIVRSHLI